MDRNDSRSLAREVLKISWPMIISELGDSLYSIADTYFVSKLGEVALAAVALSSYIAWLFFVVIALTSVGNLIYVSQSYGAKELDRAKNSIGVSIVIGLAISLISALTASTISRDILSLFTSDRSVVEVGSKYFRVRILGLPILNIAMVMDSSLRAIGATKYSMIAILSSALLNIVLDPILIFGLFGLPRLGVVGAALATVLSIVYMIPLEIVFLRKCSLLPSIHQLYIAKTVLKLGAPAAAERFVFAIGNSLYITAIARCGRIALAAHQVGIRIESFIYLPGFAFSIASASLVGQRIGAKNIEEAKRIGFEAAKLCVLFMGILGLIVAIASKIIVSPFSPSRDVAELASIYLILAGLSEPGLALALTLSGGIRGGGNTLVPMIINIVGLYLFRVLPANILVNIIGVIGAWLAMFIDVYVRGFIMFFIYSKFFHKLIRRVI
ncbi:MAG TPA: MATE family efflux transporter [Ignisphaera sp.]|nr:MATE family efflux transporter [Ignisphaera sp.]